MSDNNHFVNTEQSFIREFKGRIGRLHLWVVLIALVVTIVFPLWFFLSDYLEIQSINLKERDLDRYQIRMRDLVLFSGFILTNCIIGTILAMSWSVNARNAYYKVVDKFTPAELAMLQRRVGYYGGIYRFWPPYIIQGDNIYLFSSPFIRTVAIKVPIQSILEFAVDHAYARGRGRIGYEIRMQTSTDNHRIVLYGVDIQRPEGTKVDFMQRQLQSINGNIKFVRLWGKT